MSEQPARLSQTLEEIRQIEDRELKSEVLIEYGERFVPLPPEIASPPYPAENKIPACESDAYIFSRSNPDGTLKFYFAVENPQGISAMALAVLLDENLSGQPLDEVRCIKDELVYDLFGRGISMGKGIGLRNMVQSVRKLAERAT